jgi:hypothetical protein
MMLPARVIRRRVIADKCSDAGGGGAGASSSKSSTALVLRDVQQLVPGEEMVLVVAAK